MGAVILLRIVHIGFGVYWAGSVIFMNLQVGPAMAAAGPDGFKVMRELHNRRYFDIMLGAAILTILSGLDLMRRDSNGFSAGWFHSSFGIGLSTGMIAAIVAFILALVGIRPALRRLGMLSAQMEAAAPEARPAIGAQIDSARGRLVAFGTVGTLFMIITVLAMATARYL